MSRQIWTIFPSKNDSNHLDVIPKTFTTDDNKVFRRAKDLQKEDTDFKQIIGVKNQPVNAVRTLEQKQTCLQYIIQQRSRIWMNNSSWLTKEVTL